MEEQELQSLLDKLSRKVRYADFKTVEQSEVEIALRGGSFEISEEHFDRVSCRALDKGYGVASTDLPDEESIQAIAESATKQARAIDARVNLVPVKVEEGEYIHPSKEPFDADEARSLLLYLRQLLHAKLGNLYSGSELVLSYSSVKSTLVTSEGTDVTERADHPNLILYLVVRDIQLGYASKIVGGKGGLEVVENRDWEGIIDEMVARAKDSTKAQLLSPLVRGRRFKVILDAEAAGAVAHEIAHLLEADNFQTRFFQDIDISEDLQTVDDPQVPRAYGSFVWDDEGVRGARKVLLKRGLYGPAPYSHHSRGAWNPRQCSGDNSHP